MRVTAGRPSCRWLLLLPLLATASKDFGLYDSEATPGDGWALATASDLTLHRGAFVEQYNAGLPIIKAFHSGNCCVATAGGVKLMIPGTAHGYQFLADAAGGDLQCNPSEGYARGERYRFLGQPKLSSATTFTAATACSTSHNPGIFMRTVAASSTAASGTTPSPAMVFGMYDLQLKPGGGWRLMSAADLNEHAQDFITQYNENGGIAVIKKYKSGNCCFALAGGTKLKISGTPYGYQFPADANGELQCSPPAGYTASTYQFFRAPTLPPSTAFSSAPACVTSHNPALWGRAAALPAVSSSGAVLEFGIYDSTLSPGSGWALMSAADFATHRATFIRAYNDKGGLDVLAPFTSKNCCFAIAGGTKLSISGTPYGYQFPAAASGGIRCNPAAGYTEARYHFYRAPMLPLDAAFGESTACATNKNPGVFMRWVDALSSTKVPQVPVDCALSAWGAWSACSITCGGLGIKQRHRSVLAAPKYGGKPCAPTMLASHCAFVACPADCAVSSWEPWTACSQTCGAPGTQARARSVVAVAAHGGVACPALAQTQECLLGPCPIHCETSAFGAWSACTRSCGGGSQTRSRSVTRDAAHGGSVCPFLVQEQACAVAPCPIDCVVSGYGTPGACSKTCGGGKQPVSRSVLQPAAHGGACPTHLTELWDCATGECPVDCVLSPWGAWSACSVSCGDGASTTGRRERARTMLVPPEHGGAECATALTATTSCNVTAMCPIHCTVSSWGRWSSCSATCGKGTKRRERHVVLERDNGGSRCPALAEEVACDDGVCPIHCEVSTWGAWGLCNAHCGGGFQTRRRDIAVRPNYVVDLSIVCPALVQTRTCNEQLECAVHCQVTAWGAWGACGAGAGGLPAATCGNTTQTRARAVVVTASFNGVPCPRLSETRPCTLPTPCRADCAMTPWGAWGACTKTCASTETDVAVKWRSRKVASPAVSGGAACPPHLHDFALCRNLPSCSAAPNPYLAYFATTTTTAAPAWVVPACAAGKYAVPPAQVNPFGLGDDVCAACPAGRFQHEVGKPFCYYCPPDTAQPRAGASHCAACPRGSIARGIGALACTALPKAHHESHDTARECAAGKYVVHDAVYESAYCNFCCIDCPAGRFSALPGSTACTNCTAPAVQPRAGQSGCEAPAAPTTAAPTTAVAPHLPRGMPGMVARLRLHNVSRSVLVRGAGAAARQAALVRDVAAALGWDARRVELTRAARHAPATAAAPCSRFRVAGGGAGTRAAAVAGVYYARGSSGGLPSYRTERCAAVAATSAYELEAQARAPCRESWLYFLRAKGWWVLGPQLGSTLAFALNTAPDAVDPVGAGEPPLSVWHTSVSGGRWEAAPTLTVACEPAPETDVWVRAVAADCTAAEAARVRDLAARVKAALPTESVSLADALPPPLIRALRAGGILASRAEVVSHHTRTSCAPRVHLTMPIPPHAASVPTTCHYDGSKLTVLHDSRSRVGPAGSFSCLHREDKETGIWRCECQAWAADAATR